MAKSPLFLERIFLIFCSLSVKYGFLHFFETFLLLISDSNAFAFRFQKLQAPLQARRAQLEKKKFAYQFLRDVEDEKLWILERLPLARSADLGDSLFNCHALQKKNQVSV